MSESTFQRAFAGGEIAPSLAARADLVKHVTGLRTCRNFWVMRHGGIANRPGTRFVGETATGSTATFLLSYVAAVVGESVLLEAGPFYLRVLQARGARAADGRGGLQQRRVLPGRGHRGDRRRELLPSERITPRSRPRTAPTGRRCPGISSRFPRPSATAGSPGCRAGTSSPMTSPDVPPHELIYYGLTTWALRPVDTKAALGPPTDLTIAPGRPAC